MSNEQSNQMVTSRMKSIIKQNKKFFSFYNGKSLQFDYETGEIIRWDNSRLELIQRISKWGDKELRTFIYSVPLVTERRNSKP